MEIRSIILLIISIMLVIMSSWNLNIFIRLKDASPQYTSDDEFDSACHVSKKYVKVGNIVSIIMLCVSVLLMMGSSFVIYKQFIPVSG